MHKIPPSSESFEIKPCVIAGDSCYLVTPKHIGCKWNPDNLFYRSSLWTKDWQPVSLGYPKFFNWHEHPEINPYPKSLKGCELMEKVDGSCLIISLYKGELIIRTRGTVDATKLDTGKEIEALKQKYPRAFDLKNCLTTYDGTADHSLIFEWTGSHKIVVDYGKEPDMYLTGVVNHNDYSLISQKSLDEFAKIIKVKRPKHYKLQEGYTFEDITSLVSAFNDREGICIYYDGNQVIRKVKSPWYLSAHAFKSNATLENTLDLFFELGAPEEKAFEEYITKNYDFECFSMVKGFYDIVSLNYKKMLGIVEDIDDDVKELYGLSRKDAAIRIINKYNKLSKFAFIVLDNKELTIEHTKTILLSCIE